MSTLFHHSNETLLLVITDMMGKDVTVTLTDGFKYSGILVGCSSELAIGLRYAFKITEQNQKNLLPYASEVQEKMMFNFKDVVEVSALLNEAKAGTKAMSFATDRDYHGRNGAKSLDDRLEEWTGEDDEGLGSNDDHEGVSHDLPDQRNRRATGWSVEEMFAANREKVVSTFKDDLTQYTTVAVEGTDEDRARAERLAREIEQNQSSKFYAQLENDDIERDLDKETGEDDFEMVGNRRGKGFKQNSRQGSNGGSNNNMNNSMNRRAEALKGSDRRNSGGAGAQQRYSSGGQQGGAQYSQQPQQQQQQQQQPQQSGQKQQYSNNGRQNKNEESFDNKNKGNYPQKQMLESRPNITKPSEEERRAGKNSIISSLKNFGNEFELKDSSSSSLNAAGAWNSGPPKSLLAKGAGIENSSVVQSPPSTSNESNIADQQKNKETADTAASTSETSPNSAKSNNKNTQLNDSGEQSSGNESNTMTPSTADVSDASSNAGVSKSSSTFKFNVNAPEFVPTIKPTTPQPGTPTGGQFPPHFQQQQIQIPPQQFVQQPHDYQQQQQPQQPQGPQGAHLMQGQPIVGGPHMAANGQPVMVWQQAQQPQQYPGQYQYVQIQHAMQRGPAQQQMYNPAAGANQRGGPQQQQQPQQQPQQRMFVQQWQQPMMVQQPIGYFQPQQAAAAAAAAQQQQQQQQQYNPQQQQAQAQQQAQQQAQAQAQAQQQQQQPQFQGNQGQPLINGPPPPQGYGPQQGQGRGGYQQQQQMYMMQQGQQRYPQQGAPHEFNAAGAQGGPQSHPNSQPTTPGPQQSAGGPQQPQPVPSPGQSVSGGGSGLRQGPESGSQGSLAGSAAGSHTRSGSPQPPAPENRGPPLMNMAPPVPQPLQYMHVAQPPPMHPQMHQGQQPYYQQQIFYPQGVMYPQQHGMAMQQGPHGVGPHQAQMMGGPVDQQPPQHMMDNQGMQAMQQAQHPFVVDQYSAYQNGPTYYQPPHGAGMSRQNSVPHQYGGGPNQGGARDNGQGQQQQQQGGAGGSQSGAPSQNA